MITLRHGSYTEWDLIYLWKVVEQTECKRPDYKLCDECSVKRACEDVQRLKAHIEKLLNEHSFSEK